jgi:hypothetical protein
MSKLNRRQAISLCLAIPAMETSIVEQEKGTPTGPVLVLSNKTSLTLSLAEVDGDEWGITKLVVSYKGKQIEISAKEIWEALQHDPDSSH